MKIGITGSTGFIGKRLLNYCLAKGYSVSILIRRPIKKNNFPNQLKIYQGDIVSDVPVLEKFTAGLDILYHCAAENRVIERMQAINVQGTKNLIAAASGRIGHIVQLSSVSAYGPPANNVIEENTIEVPMSLYEITKSAADKIVREGSNKGGYSYTILRSSKVLGAGTHNKDIYKLISYIKRNMFFFIGKPGAFANYVHVDDVIEAMILCAGHEKAKNQVFNLCDKRTIEDFVGTIDRILGKYKGHPRLPVAPLRVFAWLFGWIPGYPLPTARINGLVTRVIYKTDKIEELLGYTYNTSIEQGLEEMVSEWKKM